MRRTAAWKPIAGVAAAAIAITGFGVAPATAAPDDPTQALAEVLRAQLLEGDLAGAGFAYASTPGGPASDTDPLDVALLGGDVELVTGGLQLPLITDGTSPGLLDLGQAGALESYASTPGAGTAIASSGLITDDGAIAFDVDEEPPTASTASLDATALLDQLGVDGLTDEIVDELAVQIGAVASRAEQTGSSTTSEYRVADLRLQLHSELLEALSTDLQSAVTDDLAPDLQGGLDSVVGTGGALTTILGALNLNLGLATLGLGTPTASITLADLSGVVDTALSGPDAILVSDDESVTIDLTDGSITVDLAQLVNPGGTGLNGLDPNTDVLTAETIALVTDGVANALGQVVTPLTNAIGDLVDESVIDTSIPVTASTILGPVAQGTIVIQGTVEDIVTATPATAGDYVDVTLTALGAIDLSALTTAVTNLVVGSVVGPLGTAVTTVLDASAADVSAAIELVVDGVLDTLDPVLEGVLANVATITINAQPTEAPANGDADIPGGFTVRALQVTLLPNATDSALATLSLASSTVLAGPQIITDPEGPVNPGDEITIIGSGFSCGPVTITISDGATVLNTLGPISLVDGGFSIGWTVPAGIDPTTLTIVATTPDTCGEGDDTDIDVVDPPTVTASPDPVDPGDPLAIVGTDFTCGPVTVTITDAAGDELAVLGPFALTSGAFSTSWPVPEGTEPGDLTITATTPEACGEGDDTTVTVDGPPTIVVTPDPAQPGATLEVTGSGFDCGPVDVTIVAADGTTVLATVEDVPVAADGTWSTTIVLPDGTASGTVTVVATATGVCDDEAEEEVTVDPDAVDLSVTPGIAEPGDVVDVDGSGWTDGSPVTIAIRTAGGTLVGTLTPTPSGGAFSVPWTVPAGTPSGVLTFTATQGAQEETATLTVVTIPVGPASIIVSPSTVEPGDVVAIDGEGWDPTAGTVLVVITGESGAPVGLTLVGVRPDGSLATGAFTVPPGIDAPQTLTATATQGTRTASDDFAVREAGLPVVRLGGDDRFETAVEISRDAFPFGASVVYLANGLKFPDALSAAPAAAQQDAPLLLTRQEYLEPSVIQELDRLDPDIVVILGDENSVSANVASQVDPFAGDIVRLGGANRFETSILIAEYAFNGADSAYIATGLNFPDALTAGAAAGTLGAPLLLTYGATPTPGLVSSLQGLGVDDLYIAGDANAVATSQETAFEAAGFTIAARYAGANRFDTGVLVSQASFSGSVERAYVATGLRFPDALAGSAVAGAQGVPVFVTRPTCMWADVLGEVDRLDDSQVVLLGDENALDANVFALTACAS